MNTRIHLSSVLFGGLILLISCAPAISFAQVVDTASSTAASPATTTADILPPIPGPFGRFAGGFMSQMNTLSTHVTSFEKSLSSLNNAVTSLESSLHTIFATFYGLATGNLSGITMHDAKTGTPYCLDIENGALQAHPGDCLTYLAPAVPPPASEPAPDTASADATTTLLSTATTTPDDSFTASSTALVVTPYVDPFTATTTNASTTATTTQ